MRCRVAKVSAVIALVVAGLGASLAATMAAAQTPSNPPLATPDLSAPGVRAMAANCAGCHGTNGHSAGGSIAGLAGMNRETFIEQMRLFKTGQRDATVMRQIARGFDDAELAALGGFFAAQKKQ